MYDIMYVVKKNYVFYVYMENLLNKRVYSILLISIYCVIQIPFFILYQIKKCVYLKTTFNSSDDKMNKIIINLDKMKNE